MVYIIVEGQTDKALVKNILSNKVENTDFEFLGLKGIDSVKKILEKLTEHELSQNIYFAIVDADASFETRNQEMNNIALENVEFYIFPNHKDNGDLEALLLSSIDSENKIIQCFDTYKNCVEKEIDNKAKLYAYTTLELNQKPEEYIKNLSIDDNFNELKTKLQNLFKEENR